MASDQRFLVTMNTLGPDDLRIATEAFEAALRCLHETTRPYSLHKMRLVLARYIMERALEGERDLAKLRQGALMCLDLIGSAGLDGDNSQCPSAPSIHAA